MWLYCSGIDNNRYLKAVHFQHTDAIIVSTIAQCHACYYATDVVTKDYRFRYANMMTMMMVMVMMVMMMTTTTTTTTTTMCIH